MRAVHLNICQMKTKLTVTVDRATLAKAKRVLNLRKRASAMKWRHY